MELFPLGLTSREVALIFWVSALLAVMLWFPSSRVALKGMLLAIRQFLSLKKIQIWLLSMLLYAAGMVWLLSHVSLWDSSLLKVTCLWFLFSALGSAATVIGKEQTPGFGSWLKDNIKLLVLAEYIIGYGVMPLGYELALVPLVAALTILSATADTQGDAARPVAVLLDGILAVMGVALLIFAGHEVYLHFNDFASWGTLQDFLLPPVLSLLFLPCLYALYVYISYENAFVKLHFGVLGDDLRAYARWYAILHCRLNLKVLRRWVRILSMDKAGNKADLKAALKEARLSHQREKDPVRIPAQLGWSPYLVATFLTDEGLVPRDYHRLDDEEWGASSPLFMLREQGVMMPDNLAYYITGDALVAKSLKLKLNVNNPDAPARSLADFVRVGEILLEKACPHVDIDFKPLLAGDNASLSIDGKIIGIHREDWQAGIKGGFEKILEIRVI